MLDSIREASLIGWREHDNSAWKALEVRERAFDHLLCVITEVSISIPNL